MLLEKGIIYIMSTRTRRNIFFLFSMLAYKKNKNGQCEKRAVRWNKREREKGIERKEQNEKEIN